MVTNLKEDDDGFGMLGSWYGDVDSPRWVNSVTDRRTGFQFYYIEDRYYIAGLIRFNRVIWSNFEMFAGPPSYYKWCMKCIKQVNCDCVIKVARSLCKYTQWTNYIIICNYRWTSLFPSLCMRFNFPCTYCISLAINPLRTTIQLILNE